MALTFSFVSQTTGHLYFDPNQTRSVQIVVKNTSGFTWSKTGANPVRLGTANPHDRASGFYKSGNAGWLSNNRIEMVESTVAHNANATFNFDVTNGVNTRGCYIYREYFTPVQEGVGWFSPDPNLSLDFDCRAISTFYYPWYTKEGHHWSSSVWSSGETTDIPKLSGSTNWPVDDGYYDSGNIDVMNRQMELMTEAGINNVCISYAGHGDITGDVANKFITEMQANWPNMTFCMFMDNMHSVSTAQYDVLNWYNSHPNIRVYDNKGLLLTFGNVTPTDNTRFVQVSCGANATDTGWIFGNWSLSPLKGACGTILARYDDRAVGSASGQPFDRDYTHTEDPNLTSDMFGSQFTTVKNSWFSGTLNQTRIVFFTSWNEYSERLGPIEPHEDRNISGATSPSVADDYLFQKTKTAIAQLKA